HPHRRAAAGGDDRRPVPPALRALLLRCAGGRGARRVLDLHLRRLHAGRRLVLDPPAGDGRRAAAPAGALRGDPQARRASALAAALLAASSLAVVGNRTLGLRPNLSEKAHAEAERFMRRYVDADGRVVRRDQGGDTVSEGQAYAMLLAVALDDRARFDRVWDW